MTKVSKIKVVFETEQNTFREFESVFSDLKKIEKIYNIYLFEKYNMGEINPFFFEDKHDDIKVYFISKNSPLEIGIFIKDNWEIFITIGTFIATYPRLKQGSKELLDDADYIITAIENKITEITLGFPEFEKGIIKDFVKWFLEQNESKRSYIIGRYRFIGRALNKMKKIINDDL